MAGSAYVTHAPLGLASRARTAKAEAVSQPFGDKRSLTRAERETVRLIKIALVATLVLQRVVIPGGVPAVIFVIFALVIVMWRRGLASPDPLRLLLYLVAMGVCALTATLSSLNANNAPSIKSIGLLIVVYLPLCWVTEGDRRRIFWAVLEFFVKVMAVFAMITILEFAAQLLGWRHQDFVADLVPSNMLYADFNTNYPISYGSSILKPNAFVFLEPSVCSQFLALGLLGQLLMGGRPLRLLLFATAILATVAGTGVVILIVGAVAIAFGRGLKFTVMLAVAAAIVIIVIPLTPAKGVFSSRASETSSQGTSGNLRFVAPYQRLFDSSLQSGLTQALEGQGPGAGDRQAAAYFNETSLPLISPTLPKLIVEYGVPAALAFMAFFLFTLGSAPPSIPLAVALFTFYAVLQGALLIPLMPYTCMLLSTLYSGRARPIKKPKSRLRRQEQFLVSETPG